MAVADSPKKRTLRRPFDFFSSPEHKALGDAGVRVAIAQAAASGIALPGFDPMHVALAAGYAVGYGDIVAMAGDYFRSLDELLALSAKPGTGPGTQEELEYVRHVHVWGEPHESAFTEEARAAADRRAHALDATNIIHFLNPFEGDLDRTQADKDQDVDLELQPRNAGAAYRSYHQLALRLAYDAGAGGELIDRACACEAFSNHFLTDAFASGHVRTARASIQEHWNAQASGFFDAFKRIVAEDVATQLKDHSDECGTPFYVRMLTEGLLTDLILKKLETALAARGITTYGFGDVVSLALHDADNKKGVKARIAGEVVQLFGDDQLIDGEGKPTALGARTHEVAVRAAAASLGEVVRARQAGVDKQDYRAFHATLVDGSGLMAAERLLPQVLPDADQDFKSIQWKRASWKDLFADAAFCEALGMTARGLGGQLGGIVASLDTTWARKAFQRGVVDPLIAGRDSAVAYLQRALSAPA